MIRSIFRCLVNWTEDSARDPQWLKSMVESDQRLQAFDDELTAMTAHLRDGAKSWADTAAREPSASDIAKFNVVRVERESSYGVRLSRHASLAFAGFAAAVLLAIIFGSPSATPPRIDPVVPANNAIAADLRGVGAEIHALANICDKSAFGVESALMELPASIGLASITVDLESIRQATRSPLDAASRRYGQALDVLDRGIRSQLKAETSDGASQG